MPFGGIPTPHYGFGQYLDTDKTDWADNTQTNAKVDTALYGVEQEAMSSGQQAQQALGVANEANQAAIAAGNKADIAADLGTRVTSWANGTLPLVNSVVTWTSGSIRYTFNDVLNLLELYGEVRSPDGSFDRDMVVPVCNLLTIPGFVVPSSNIVVDGAAFNNGYSVRLQITPSGILNFIFRFKSRADWSQYTQVDTVIVTFPW